jgi:hypothetical protein
VNPTRSFALLLALATLAFTLAAEPHPAADAPYQSPGTQKMAALLEQIFHEQDWTTDPNKAAERASHLREDLANNPSLRDEIKIREVLAENLLKAGDSAGESSNSKRFARSAKTMASSSLRLSTSLCATTSPQLTCAWASRKTASTTTGRIRASIPSRVEACTSCNEERKARSVN